MTGATPPPQGKPTEPSKPATGTATVTVACKVPNGMILQLSEMVESFENLFGGGQRRIEVSVPVGPRVVVRGSAIDKAKLISGEIDYMRAGGYALTPGVPKDFWDAWVEQHKYADYVVNKQIMAYGSEQGALSMARDHAAVRSGFEPIDPANPGKSTGMHSIVPADVKAPAWDSLQ